MEWLIGMLVAFFLFRMIGFSCPLNRLRARHDVAPARVSASSRESGGRADAPMSSTATPARAEIAAAGETPMQSLQRRFVEGRITVEQYEAELDRLFARRGGKQDPAQVH